MNQKLILSFLILFLLISFSFLAYTEKKQHQIKNQWFLYFENPTADNLNFIIENHTPNTDFSWKVISEKDNHEIKQGKITVLNNEKKVVNIEKPHQGIIKVKHSSNQKIIYKK